MSIEHWDTDLPGRVHEAAAFLQELAKREPAGTALADDLALWLREYDAWKASHSEGSADV